MNILLIQPPIRDFYSTPIRFYPLGLLYIGSFLKQQGHNVKIFNSLERIKSKNISLPEDFYYLLPFINDGSFPFKNFKHFGYSLEYIKKILSHTNPDIIGISSNYTAYFDETLQICKIVRELFPDKKIVVGGHHISALYNEINNLNPFSLFDYMITGPGEYSFLELIKYLNNEIPGNQLKNIMGKEIKKTSSSKFENWKKIIPDRSLINQKKYNISNKNYISISASRGCAYNCAFCGINTMFGKNPSYRAVKHVITEILSAIKEYNIDICNFEDDNLSWNKEWFKILLQNIISVVLPIKKIEFTAMNGICADSLNEETIILLKKSGFKSLNLSLISKHETILSKNNRPFYSTQVEKIIKFAKKQDLFLTVYLIIGLPGDTVENITASIEYLDSLNILIGPSIYYPVPGTKSYKECINKGYIAENSWKIYRSSAFSVETETISRQELISLFNLCREKNLQKI